jgi:hypothetical protein
VDSIILKALCISIRCKGSEVSEKTKNRDKKFDHPVLVVVYPIGKLLSKTVFIAYTNEKKPSVAIGTSYGK